MSSMRVIVDVNDDCRPGECSSECKKVCPVVRMGKECIQVGYVKATVFSDMCVNCGLCAKHCPKKAISVVLHETP